MQACPSLCTIVLYCYGQCDRQKLSSCSIEQCAELDLSCGCPPQSNLLGIVGSACSEALARPMSLDECSSACDRPSEHLGNRQVPQPPCLRWPAICSPLHVGERGDAHKQREGAPLLLKRLSPVPEVGQVAHVGRVQACSAADVQSPVGVLWGV